VTAAFRLLQQDRRADFGAGRQRSCGYERIVSGIEHQRRHRDAAQPRLAACAQPVIVRTVESVQRRGDHVVEGVHGVGAVYRGFVELAGKAARHRQRLRYERL
jgi:hypothetical protein